MENETIDDTTQTILPALMTKEATGHRDQWKYRSGRATGKKPLRSKVSRRIASPPTKAGKKKNINESYRL